jgi:hypothetical protein
VETVLSLGEHGMREDQQQPLSGGHAGHTMRGVVSALEAGRAGAAVREFMQAVSSATAPQDEQLIPWLVSEIGKPKTAQLVEAFVHFPCFYCTKGRMSCETCEARGHTEAGAPCERCLGMRLERCDFCNGSGWVTINYVPAGLQPLVMKGRGTLAIERMRALLALRPPDIRSREPRATIKQTCVMILNMDRQMGVFENMTIVFNQLPSGWPRARKVVEPLIVRCIALAAKAETRICELVRTLGEVHRCWAEAAGTGPSERKGLVRRAQFYESLVDPSRSLAGTGLTHPLLHEVIRRCASDRSRDRESERTA